jgi:hypothetical protein
MTQYDNTNRGQIWPNDRKEKDTQPDFKGSINVEGEEYWVSAWKRKPDANPKAPSLSFSIQKKDEQAPEQPPAASGAAGDGFDDIPF